MRPIKVQIRSTFLRRHSRFITFCGALIVFATFVVKDAVRDHLKGVVDAQQVAETTFIIWSKNLDAIDMLSDITANVDTLVAASTSNGPKSKDSKIRKDMYLLVHRLQRITNQTGRVLELVAPLVDNMPEPDQKEFGRLERNLKELQSKQQAIAQDVDKVTFDNEISMFNDQLSPRMRDNEQFIHDAIGFPEQIALKFFVEKHHAEVRDK